MAGFVTVVFFLLLSLPCLAQLQVDTSFSEQTLVLEVFVSDPTDINTICYHGSYQALGLLTAENNSFPYSKGIILSTGMAKSAAQPNRSPNHSAALYTNGDETLSKLGGSSSYDAAVLEFTFRPKQNTVAFEYIFASEEYPEYVDKGFNDAFAFILTDLETKEKKNLAVVPGTSLPVQIDNINHNKNTNLFLPNTRGSNSSYLKLLEYDGLTQVLTAQSEVVPGRCYRIKIAIADVDDRMLDSSVILKEKSFRSFHQLAEASSSDSDSNSPWRVYFDWNSSRLNKKEKNKLELFANQVLSYQPKAIYVTGHADADGSSDYNEQLARTRVQSVVNFLAQLGLRDKVILYRRSRGENQPIASNESEKGRATNRRVEIKMVFD